MVHIDPAHLARSLQRLEPMRDGDITAALEQVITACVELFDVTGSGLMISDEDNVLRAAVASDGPGRVLEEVQARTGQGPCVDTFVHRHVVTTEDLATEQRNQRSAGGVRIRSVRLIRHVV